MSLKIEKALLKLFEQHRVVFWYDEKNEFAETFTQLKLKNVQNEQIDNNEFNLKHQVLRQQPKQKFLLYKNSAAPEYIDNWLLDIQLANTEFRTDQVAIWLSELSLDMRQKALVEAHVEFFKAKKRVNGLKGMLNPTDPEDTIKLKMLAVCCNSDAEIDAVLESLFAELAEGNSEKEGLLERCGLTNFVWEQISRIYGYDSTEPGIRDFAIELFNSCFNLDIYEPAKLNRQAIIFLKRWKNNRLQESAFIKLSEEFSGVLNTEKKLHELDFRKLMNIDYFELIDKKIISSLVDVVTSRSASSGDIALWVRQRKQSHWYIKYEHLYQAIDFASMFFKTTGEIKLNMDSMTQGVEIYSQSWFKVDQLYRKFIYHVKQSGQVSMLEKLVDEVENFYSNQFLLQLGNRFQEHVENNKNWRAFPVTSQNKFFETHIQPYLKKQNRVCVVVSDALRYEIGDELVSLIQSENRYQALLEPMLSMLPSYTQLGMASLLPHKKLSIKADESAHVLADDKPTLGTNNRSKILKEALDDRGSAISFSDIMKLSSKANRALLKANDVLYIYHNRIDHTGDKLQSEGEVFEAAEHTLSDLIKLVKKLTADNVSNIVITADHGFIYQNRPIESTDFSSDDIDKSDVLFKNRRYVIGQNLKKNKGFHHFESAELGLSGDVEIQIPKSINRLRVKGSGSRFVHGGASLQEVVIPMIKINKKRQDDVRLVAVEFIGGSSSVITTGQLSVKFYQGEAVNEKMQPRILRAGIYAQDGTLISDSHDLVFDLEFENAREREIEVQFVLSRKAEEVNNQDVYLRLEERHQDTSHYKEYKSQKYTVRRSFTSDFDF